jgi:autotransporter-associated beta strand protein
LLVLLLAASHPVIAASRTWTGLGGDLKWTTAANWAGNASPVPGDFLVFPQGSGENDFPPFTAFEGFFFTCTSCGASGNSVTLGPGGIRTSLPAINLQPTFVDLDLALGSDSALGYANSYLGFRGAISGAHNLSIGGSGQGAIILFGANTYSGRTIVNGEVHLVNDRALGASDGTPATGTTVTHGSLALLDALTIGNEALTLDDAVLRSPWVSSWAGPITLNATNTIQVDAWLTFGGPITGTGGITKTGPGLLRLTAANTYSGPTVINAGTLSVENSQPSSAIRVNGGATLTGTSAAEVGSVAVTGGRITPGALPGDAATITANGALTLNAAGRFVVDLNSATSFDRLVVNGTVDLGGSTLNLNHSFGSVIGDTSFDIVVNDGTDAVVGTFNGLPEGASFSLGGSAFRISYVAGTGNDVTLARVAGVTPTPVPVPVTDVPMLDGRGLLVFGLMIAGAGFLMLIRRT